MVSHPKVEMKEKDKLNDPAMQGMMHALEGMQRRREIDVESFIIYLRIIIPLLTSRSHGHKCI
jgi:hypothetical protein